MAPIVYLQEISKVKEASQILHVQWMCSLRNCMNVQISINQALAIETCTPRPPDFCVPMEVLMSHLDAWSGNSPLFVGYLPERN